ncbi:MAG: phage tail protein, partial [Cytophagaceae bacterium]|nr:phage tail protein [Cytophagaceae bacterium]
TTYTYSKVGIGTNAPSQALTVAGNAQVSGSVSAARVYGEGAVPAGAIMMWSGSPTALPVGWALCDGQSGRPDLRGRFVVGYDPTDADYNATQRLGPVYSDADGASTGANTQDAKQVRLTGNQSGTAAHSHTINDPGHTHNISTTAGWGQLIVVSGYDVHRDDGSGNTSFDNVAGTSLVNSTNTTGITVSNAIPQNAVQAIENRPPYYVLAYIIKVNY